MAPALGGAGKAQLPHFPLAAFSSSPLPPPPPLRGGSGASPRWRGEGRPLPGILPPRRCFCGGGEGAVRSCLRPRAPPVAGLQRYRLPPLQPGAGGGERKQEKGKRHYSHWAAARGISSSCRGPRGRLGPAALSPPLPGLPLLLPPSAVLWGCCIVTRGLLKVWGAPRCAASREVTPNPCSHQHRLRAPEVGGPYTSIYTHTCNAYIFLSKQDSFSAIGRREAVGRVGRRGVPARGRTRVGPAGVQPLQQRSCWSFPPL